MNSKIVVILMVAVSLAAGLSSYFGREKLAHALNEKALSELEKQPFQLISIEAVPVVLNPESPDQQTAGALLYVAGWQLTSEDEGFGGWSGLTIDDAHKVTAINDQGNWLTASFKMGAQKPVSAARIAPFDQSGEEPDKEDYDAESLIAIPTGFLIGFEQQHRIMHMDEPATGAVTPFETGVDFTGLAKNGGIEAMALLPDNKLVMFAENGRDTDGRTKAWLSSTEGVVDLDFMPPENYSPTDAAALPNGDVLLLLRHYSVMTGASAKLLHISAEELTSGVVRGREIATIAKPLTVDNMEGLDIEQKENGSYRLYMISDDNFSSRQRTLLMVFDWSPETAIAQTQ